MTEPVKVEGKYPAAVFLSDPEIANLFNVVGITPHIDLDTVYTWNGDDLHTVEITGLGKTKTITYTYSDGKLVGKTVVIT